MHCCGHPPQLRVPSGYSGWRFALTSRQGSVAKIEATRGADREDLRGTHQKRRQTNGEVTDRSRENGA